MIDALLDPKSIAVVGVSLEALKVGHQVFANLLSFPGDVFPINPKHKKILGKSCFPDLLSIPAPVDLVVICTPAASVEDVINQCIDKKVKAVIVITAGFAENGKAGKELQASIAEKLRANNILLLGPNTLGAINPHSKMNASFAPADISKGTIGLISQSGAMLTTVFSQFAHRKVGCSFALSLGNSAGVGATEALEYAQDDPHTKVIALYLESLPAANPKQFFALCKKISKSKPILLLKGGVTDHGQQASLSHTAALATDSTLLREAQYQYGYTMVDTIEQFFETSFFLDRLLSANDASTAALPSSLMILTNAGGPGVNSIDLADKASIRLATWSPASIQRFAAALPRVRPSNPTDILGDANETDIESSLIFANEDPLIDSILLILTPQAVTDIPGIVRMLIATHSKLRTPLIVALMTGELYRHELVKLREAGICAVEYSNEAVEIYEYVSNARKAMLVDRSQVLMNELAKNLGPAAPSQQTRRSMALRSTNLEEVYLLLEAYGLTLPHAAIVSDPSKLDELDELDASRVYPLIAKTANLGLKHKAVLGAVIGDINSKEDAKSAYEKLVKFGPKVLFQEVIEDAIEVIIGCRKDPSYGTFLAVGTGGSLTNILADRSYIFLPASGKEIRATLKRTKLSTLLSATQREQVLLCIERFQYLMNEHPEIIELEINPLMLTADTAYVADVKVTLTQ